MAEQSENVVLEILRRIQSDIAETKNDIKDIKASPLSSTSTATTMQPEVKCVPFGTVAPFPSA